MKKEGNNIEKIYPLTSMQEGMLFHSIKEKSDVYFNQLFYTSTGEIDLTIFTKTLDVLSKRHDVLRTAFVFESTERPVQVVLKNRTIDTTILDKTDLDSVAYQVFIDDLKRNDVKKGFDLLKDPIIRLTIVKREEELYDFLWSYHHIILDGWCLTVMFEELQEIYFSLKENKELSLPTPLPFNNYVKWLSKVDKKRSLNYWENYLDGYNHVAEIPQMVSDHKYGTDKIDEKIDFDKETSKLLHDLAKKNKVTLNDVFQTVWGLLIAKYSGGNEVVYGNVVSGRPAELEGADRCLGLFINTIPVRLQFKEEETFLDLTKKIHDDFLNGLPHHYNSLVDIVNTTEQKGDLIKHIIAFENYPLSEEEKQEKKLFEVLNVEFFDCNNYDFDLDVELGEKINVNIAYNPNYYHPDYVKKIANSLESLVYQFIENPNQKISDINFINEADREELLHIFNKSEVNLNNNAPINVLFENGAKNNAEKIAITHNGVELTYKELNKRANQIANALLQNGLEKGDFIGLHLDRSPELIAALMAVFKAGGIYVPLDTQNPPARTQELIQDGELKALITEKEVLLKLNETNVFESELKQVLCLDEKIGREQLKLNEKNIIISSVNEIASCSIENPINKNSITDWAYMLYTSGSTGKPKGAISRYNGALNHILAEFDDLELKDGFCFLQSASIASDISVWQMIAPLLKGGMVLIADKEDVLDYQKTLDLISKHNVTIAEFVPSYLLGLIDYVSENNLTEYTLSSLEWMMLSGEEAPVKMVNDWLKLFPNTKVLNGYGPCEASDDITQHKITEPIPPHITKVPIGKPIHNMNIFVLDNNEKLVPVGVPGEICVSGIGVGAGYFKDAEKTEKSFKTNPFPNTLGDTIYKTGDLGRWLVDGNLEFLGRKDRQVKIRGNRVELGEISAFIRNNIEFVDNAAVVTYKNTSSDVLLLAFIVLKEQNTQNEEDFKKELIAQCLQGLPQYMQPTQFIFVASLPQNLSDKVDERKLITYYENLSTQDTKVETPVALCNTETERILKGIWEQILQRNDIGIYDDFFEVGGHSLSAIKVKAAVFKNLKVNLEIFDLFNYTKLNELANFIEQKIAPEEITTTIVAQKRPEKIPLSYAQEGLWFIDSLQGSTEYNIAATLKLKGRFDTNLMETCLRTIIQRHETLRSVIIEEDTGIPHLEFLEAKNWNLSICNLLEDMLLIDEIENLTFKPFDLAKDFKLKAYLIPQEEDVNVLVLVMHHMASDGWSESILVDELLELYDAGVNNRTPKLEKLDIQYTDYILWQQKDKNKIENQAKYWKEKLKDVEKLNFPTDYPRSKNQEVVGGSVEFSIDKDLLDKLKKFSIDNGSTLYMTLLSVYNVLLFKYTNQQDICIGTPVAGRTNQDLENLIGFFVNVLVMRNNVASNKTFKDFLLEVKRTSLEAFRNQEIPFDRVVKETVKHRDLSRSPLHQVLFTLQNTPEVQEIKLTDLEVELVKPDHLQVLADLHFLLEEESKEQNLILEIEYRKSLFNVETIQRLGQHYIQLLNLIVENPDEKIGNLNMLSFNETKELLTYFSTSEVEYSEEITLLDLFADQVNRTPESVAITYKENNLTFKELDERSTQFANYLLHTNNINIEDLVGVKIERSDWLIIALFGVLKSGAVYLPIDPNYPKERIAYIENDSQCKLVIDAKFIEEFESSVKSNISISPTINGNNLAYVIYTSGSTGKPKGVMIEHKGIVNTILAQISTFKIEEGTKCLQFANQCFDASVWEIFLSILGGGSLYIIEEEKKTDKEYFINFLQKNSIDCAVIPPAYLKILDVEELSTLNTLVTGGEEAPYEQVKLFKQKGKHYVNAYGPTEASICATAFEGIIDNPVSIGKPIRNTEAYILDESQSLVPVGVVGELCVAGAGLARGYLNAPDLTNKKFVPHLFKDGQRMYKTGDLAKWLPNGNIAFVGRIDDQIKIRGYRVELGEIENVLLKHEAVSNCAVLAKKDTTGVNNLVGYLVVHSDISTEALEMYLKELLPEYMVPRVWVVLSEMPLNTSGKIDKKLLPEPVINLASNKEYVSPRNELEKALVIIWQKLLKLNKIGIHDDFFELGGHSLLVTQLVSQIREQQKVEIAIKDIFEFKTVEELASFIRYKGLKIGEEDTSEYKVTIEI